ncbi:MAG: TonB-dependent receptor [Bacteroidia bacterium]|nr:TonB-dependent receptor [Bacteroidia bacterium]
MKGSNKLCRILVTIISLFLTLGMATAQNLSVTGKIVDAQGQSVVGASIVEKGTTNGTMSNLDGGFTIRVKDGASLEISFVGYTTQVLKAEASMRIVLKEDAEFLSDAVVVGFGTQKKESLTGAVASVNVGKALESRPISDVGRGLQGSTPGLNVRIGSNEVGSDPILRIRGQVGSYQGSASPLILLDNVEIPSINLVNPDDIESISVLKDAASASIYGAKAAFGVILITSKKGAKETDKVTVTYSGNLSFQNMAKNYEMATVDGLHYTVEAAERVGTYTPVGAFWYVDRAAYEAAYAWQKKYGKTVGVGDPYTYGRDWYVDGNNRKMGIRTFNAYDYLVRKNAPTQTHNISVAGNKGRTNYNISLGYLDQNGMLKVTDYDWFKRYNANARINTQINDWLNVHTGIMFTRSTKSWAFATNSTTADVWYYVFRWGPTFPMEATNEYGDNIRTAAYELATANQATKNTTYASVNVGTTITPVKNWNINIDYTYANNNSQERDPGITYMAGDTWAAPVNALDASGNTREVANEWQKINGLGKDLTAKKLAVSSYTSTYDSIYQDSFTSQRQTWNITSDYDLNLNDTHMFKFLLGFQAVGYDYTGVWGKKMTLIDIGNPQFDLATGTQTSGGSASWSSTAGFFGRINYNYKEKYLLEANLRYDGSSKFPTRLQWRWFPSVSAGWRVTQEPWMQPYTDVLSSLKLRASWGSIGDQSVASSLYIPTMSAMTSYWIHSGVKDVAYNTPGVVHPDITWQDIETYDIGVDMSLFHQVNVTFDWYRRNTNNMIVGMEGVSYNLGASAPNGNFGSLRTDGWELSVNWGRSFSNGLNLSVTASVADAKSIITDYGSSTTITGWYNGMTYGEIWGYKVDRLFQKDDFAYDASGNLILDKDKHGSYYVYADGKDYATQGKISSGSLISGPGDVKFVDLNGDGVIDNGSNLLEDHGDLTVIGNTTPRYEYSFRIDADWKGFDFSIFFQGIGKRDMWGSSSMTLPGFNTSDGAMAQTFAGDFWYDEYEITNIDGTKTTIPANYDAFYPRAADTAGESIFNMVKSDRYLLNMAYLRIKNITLGYTLPQNLTKLVNLQKARVYVSLENFFTFDHLKGLPIDPEEVAGYSSFNSSNYNSSRAGVGTPAFKSASVGLQLTF